MVLAGMVAKKWPVLSLVPVHTATWWLRASGLVGRRCFRTPRRATFEEMGRVHTPEHLESLARPEALATIFGVDPSDVPTDELLDTIRLPAAESPLGVDSLRHDTFD